MGGPLVFKQIMATNSAASGPGRRFTAAGW